MLNTTLTLITMYYIERRYMMQGEFDNDWNDVSILDTKLIDKEFDNTIEEDFGIVQRIKDMINEETED